jgi:hypothetical protein
VLFSATRAKSADRDPSADLEAAHKLDVTPRQLPRERTPAVPSECTPCSGTYRASCSRTGPPGSAITLAGDGHGRLRSAGYDADTKEHAFVAMPFAESFDDLFHYGIVPPIRGAGLICERLDELSFTGDVVQRLKERIDAARIVVADLTNANPNVYLEVGYAWGRDIPVAGDAVAAPRSPRSAQATRRRPRGVPRTRRDHVAARDGSGAQEGAFPQAAP